jgi:DNA-binding NarL/FixJ family response regulator
MSSSSDSSQNTIRILIADDHPVVREGLATILELETDMKVVGQAHDGDEACKLYQQLSPDILTSKLARRGFLIFIICDCGLFRFLIDLSAASMPGLSLRSNRLTRSQAWCWCEEPLTPAKVQSMAPENRC